MPTSAGTTASPIPTGNGKTAPGRSWPSFAFWLSGGASLLFVVLTFIAMFLYPGGTLTDPTTTGYSFCQNFFSDLGRLQARNGQPNPASAMLFTTALTLAGSGLILFFLAFRQFFRSSTPVKLLSTLGSGFGTIAGLCFIGVAWAPADRASLVHIQAVLGAFRAFPLAATLYTLAILGERHYPRRYAVVFGLFAVLLGLYLLLLTRGPTLGSAQGLVIQVVGQKVIVYAAILSIVIQSAGAWRACAAGAVHESGHEYTNGESQMANHE